MKLNITQGPKFVSEMSAAMDIMFLLLIYFMVGFSSISQQSLQVSLPETLNSDICLHHISITINSDLNFYLDNELIEKKNIVSGLKAKLNDNINRIMIYVDKSVAVEHLIFVADAAASLGMKATIATSQKDLVNG